MPSARFSHTAVAGSPVEVVWDRLQQAETWSAIGPIEDVSDAVHSDGALRSFRWKTTVGPTSYRATATVTDSEAPSMMRLRLDAGEVSGELVADFAPEGADATRLDITLEVSSRGLLSTMFFPAISKAIGSGLPDQVDVFAASFGD